MIPGDQGGGGWGYQVVNIGGARSPTLPAESAVVESHPCAKNAQELGTRESHPSGSAQGKLLRKKTRNVWHRASVPSDSRLTEVTANLRRVPV
jgi:hypothetical protein